jgi:hypothetical protein
VAKKMIQLKNRIPLTHAQTAYNDGYYIEGMQILHANLEISLRIFLLMIRKENGAESQEIEDILAEFNYTRCTKLLFILGSIDKNLFDNLVDFHKWNNFIISKLLLPVYKEDVPQVSIEQYDRAFHLGVFLNKEILHILEHTHEHLALTK